MVTPIPCPVGQRERLAEIARVSWCLTPELGDRAAELSSNADDLSACLGELHRALLAVVSIDADGRALAAMPRLRAVALLGLDSAQRITPLSGGELDAGVSCWLADRGMSREVAFSPAFLQARLGEPFLHEVFDAVGMPTLSPVLTWLSLTVEADLLLAHLEGSLEWIALLQRSGEGPRLRAGEGTALIGLYDLLASTLVLLRGHRPACGHSLPRTTDVSRDLGCDRSSHTVACRRPTTARDSVR